MRTCSRCGRVGNWLGLCPDCRQAEALEDRNRIDRERLKNEQEESKRRAKEQRYRDEERIRQEQAERQRQFAAEERDREERRQIERDRIAAEEKDREERRQIERDRIAAEERRYEEEKRERERKEEQERCKRILAERAEAWAKRCEDLDKMSDEDMKFYFEIESDTAEREYLKQRYRNCISPEDYLLLIKDEAKYITQKHIQHYLQKHSERESIDYLLNISPSQYASVVEKEYLDNFIIEKEPVLKDFLTSEFLKKEVEAIDSEMAVATKTCQIFLNNYKTADEPEKRQIWLRIIVSYLRFLQMSATEKQIFFREFTEEKMKDVEFNPNGYEGENGILYTAIEPLYICALDAEEQKKYLNEKQRKEENFRAKVACVDKINELKKQVEQKNDELKQKIILNEQIVANANSINGKRAEVMAQLEKLNTDCKKANHRALFSLILFLMCPLCAIILTLTKMKIFGYFCTFFCLGWPVWIYGLVQFVKFVKIRLKIKKISEKDKIEKQKWDELIEQNACLIKEIESINSFVSKIENEKSEIVREYQKCE